MSDDPEGPHQPEANGGAALFAPGLLHELRQPLMGLRAGLELALRESGGQVSSLEGFRVVEAQVERLSEMVRGFEELFRFLGVVGVFFAIALANLAAIKLRHG